jgi:hypothetical protein
MKAVDKTERNWRGERSLPFPRQLPHNLPELLSRDFQWIVLPTERHESRLFYYEFLTKGLHFGV